jgi:hypothetical protein
VGNDRAGGYAPRGVRTAAPASRLAERRKGSLRHARLVRIRARVRVRVRARVRVRVRVRVRDRVRFRFRVRVRLRASSPRHAHRAAAGRAPSTAWVG